MISLEYLNSSRVLLSQIDDHLGKILIRHPKIVVWGTGQLTFKLLADTKLKDFKISAFFDNNPVYWGRKLNGIEILPPKDIIKYSEPILVSSNIHEKVIVETIRHKIGLQNEIILLR